MTQVDETEEEDKLPKATSTITDAGAARKRIEVTIPEERIQGKLKESFDELQKDVVLPGFRNGRAPAPLRKTLRRRLRNTLKGQLVAEAYQKAVEDHKLDAIGEPEINMSLVNLPDSGPLVAALDVEITPDFELPNIEKVQVKSPPSKPTMSALNLAVENLRRHFGQWQDAKGAATEDDAVLCDVKVQDPENNVLTEQQNVQLNVKPGNIGGLRFEDLGDKLEGAASPAHHPRAPPKPTPSPGSAAKCSPSPSPSSRFATSICPRSTKSSSRCSASRASRNSQGPPRTPRRPA